MDTFVAEEDAEAGVLITVVYAREAVDTFAGTIAFVGREWRISRVVGERMKIIGGVMVLCNQRSLVTIRNKNVK